MESIPPNKCTHPYCAGCTIPGALAEMHFQANEQLKYVTRERAFEESQWNCMEKHWNDE